MNKNEWQRVGYESPSDGEEVLIYYTINEKVHYDIIRFDQYENWPSGEITHWMPLPEPPGAES